MDPAAQNLTVIAGLQQLQDMLTALGARSSRPRSMAITKIDEAIMWLERDTAGLTPPPPAPPPADPPLL